MSYYPTMKAPIVTVVFRQPQQGGGWVRMSCGHAFHGVSDKTESFPCKACLSDMAQKWRTENLPPPLPQMAP